MKTFARLISNIDQTNSTNEKVNYLTQYFQCNNALTIAWAVHILMGKQKKKIMTSAGLRKIVNEQSQFPDWLMKECYAAVGDTAEMISLIVDAFPNKGFTDESDLTHISLIKWMEEKIPSLSEMNQEQKAKVIADWWHKLNREYVFILNKLMTGALRIGLSDSLVIRALAEFLSVSKAQVAAKLMSSWIPSANFIENILQNNSTIDGKTAVPLVALPFCLAAPLESSIEKLGNIADWLIEWKWDGIRAQIAKLGDVVEIWSRGEERLTGSFPDLVTFFKSLNFDGLFDGEIVAGNWRVPSTFQELQSRINKKSPNEKFVKSQPVAFIAYDCLNLNGEDLRSDTLSNRREKLENIFCEIVSDQLGVSKIIRVENWAQLTTEKEKSRLLGAEGFILKNKNSVYEAGRKRGIWYKWKLDPLTLDVVLTAAQPGTGKRASLYTDYTFSIWKGDTLVPIAKAYSGLNDEEIRKLDSWIRKNTVERFGPVRTLNIEKVYEIGFEGVGISSRHKAGYAVRFPRVLRERIDKKPQDANTVEDVQKLAEFVNRRLQ